MHDFRASISILIFLYPVNPMILIQNNDRARKAAPELFAMVGDLLDRLETVDPDYYSSELVAAANDLIANLDGSRDDAEKTSSD